MAVAVEAPSTRLAESLRGRITDAAPAHADTVVESLVEAIKTTKRVKGHCEKCDAWVTVQVQDATAATNAIKVLIEQTEGRPGVAEAETLEALTVHRTTYATLDATHALTLLDAGNLEALRLELVSSLPLDDGGEPPATPSD